MKVAKHMPLSGYFLQMVHGVDDINGRQCGPRKGMSDSWRSSAGAAEHAIDFRVGIDRPTHYQHSKMVKT
jgi:hypothetical protein